tara:strand:+ start:441 stop:1244 length:804 start_codon:yes stop_codon:yes gene_type:complete
MKLTTKKIYKLIQEQIDEKALKAIQSVISKGDIPQRYALYAVGFDDDSYSLVLYQLPPLKTEVVAYCKMQKTAKPCIPATYEVLAIARNTDRDYKGVGAVMYDIAATIIKQEHSGGITSDHSSSSSTAAYKVWQKMLKSGKYKKRATRISGGKNDKFDYDNSTPADPVDDCDLPKYGAAASDHSLQIINDSPYLDKFLNNHTKAMKVAKKAADALGQDFDANEIEDALESAGFKLFKKVYTGGSITVLTKEYFSIWNRIKRAIGVEK